MSFAMDRSSASGAHHRDGSRTLQRGGTNQSGHNSPLGGSVRWATAAAAVPLSASSGSSSDNDDDNSSNNGGDDLGGEVGGGGGLLMTTPLFGATSPMAMRQQRRCGTAPAAPGLGSPGRRRSNALDFEKLRASGSPFVTKALPSYEKVERQTAYVVGDLFTKVMRLDSSPPRKNNTSPLRRSLSRSASKATNSMSSRNARAAAMTGPKEAK